MTLRGSLVTLRHESRVLRGNALRDPHVRDLHVYLPPSYDGKRRFPLVFVLTGFTGRGASLLNARPWLPSLPEQLEKLRAREMIFAFPDCFTRYGGSQYLDSSATGRYEQYVARELVRFVDARFRTIPRAVARAVMGKSSGGYGALRLGMRRPDVFGLVACHSGDLYFDYCYWNDFPKYLGGLPRHGGSTRAFLRKFAAAPKKTGEMVTMMNIAAMAACYSPNPRAPLGFDLPFDERTGEVRAAVWRRWKAHDPIAMLPRHAEALRALRLLFIDCGTRDEYSLHFGARIFAERLRTLRIPHVHEEFDDGHMDIAYRYDRSIALIARRIATR
ncbi:MAG: alpha/beta hydrolase-fold protein [Myxococcota bacterium]